MQSNNQQPVTPPSAPPPINTGANPVQGSQQAVQSQAKRNPNSAQNMLLLSELRDNMVIMSDGSFRAVITCKSINFDLMSSREREGVEYAYQSFLNSLTFPVQILIRSQRVDIAPYLDRLETIRKGLDNMLLGVLMDNYIDFMDRLAAEANIMDKSFFVIVPYYPAGDLNSAVNSSKNLFSALFKPQQQANTKINEDVYNKAKDELQNRVNTVLSGLFQMGVRSVQLNTKELGELYYNFYNPDTAVHQPLGDFENVTNTYIRKGEGEAARPHLAEGI
jgi:type IV secretory pathway VirB4 component